MFFLKSGVLRMSLISHVPSGFSALRIDSITAAGRVMSCRQSNVITKSYIGSFGSASPLAMCARMLSRFRSRTFVSQLAIAWLLGS